MRNVSYSKRNGVGSERLVSKGRTFRVSLLPGDVVTIFHCESLSLSSDLANLEHVLVNVKYCNVALQAFGILQVLQIFQISKSYVACTTGGVEQFATGRWTKLADENIFPDSVNSAAHHVVH